MLITEIFTAIVTKCFSLFIFVITKNGCFWVKHYFCFRAKFGFNSCKTEGVIEVGHKDKQTELTEVLGFLLSLRNPKLGTYKPTTLCHIATINKVILDG